LESAAFLQCREGELLRAPNALNQGALERALRFSQGLDVETWDFHAR
jgi:hypothetical protein